jgi:hypothetical protein
MLERELAQYSGHIGNECAQLKSNKMTYCLNRMGPNPE